MWKVDHRPTATGQAVRTLAAGMLAALGCAAVRSQTESTAAAAPPRYDLVLVGGTVVDGTGSEPRPADLAVTAGRIVAVGTLPEPVRAAAVVDVTGRTIAPGFIDVHAHADVAARRRPDARNYVAMGVTTIITGNCGSSVGDVADHLRRVEANGISVHYGTLIGHGTVRVAAMGRDERPPSPFELDAMRAHVRRAMEAGAFGMSTGLIYVPGTYADTAELIELGKVVATFGGLYASHMRNEGNSVLSAIDEALTIGRVADIPVHLSHLKASGKPNWGRAHEIAEFLRDARADGVRVTGDQYAYTASSTSLDILFPSSALAIGRKAFAAALRDDTAFRDRMRQALFATMDAQGFGDLSYCQIATAPNHTEWNGLRISAAAERAYGRADREAQADLAIELMARADGRRVSMVYHKMDEADVTTLLALPFVAVAADAGIRLYATASKPHPRGAGNNARVLGRYVRERRALSLPLAVQKMTSLPARIFGLADHGEIRPGALADLVVFSPDEIADRATYEDPLAAPVGIDAVYVRGELVVDDGEHTGARPGLVLRHRLARRR